MKDSAAKRTADSKSLTAKGGAKADTEAALEAHTEKRGAAGKELMATEQYIAARKAARAGEVESLKQAKAVLSGADYSLLQQTVRRAGFLAKNNVCSVEGRGISADMTQQHNYYSQTGGGTWTFKGK